MFSRTLKQILPLAIGAFVLGSCASSKNAVSVPSRDDVKGTWVLDRITYDNQSSGNVRLTLLDEGNEACVTGSTWVLPNNGYGSYTIQGTGCTPGQRNIVWSYQKNGDQPIFQYKRLAGGEKAKNIADGYRFKILSADAGSLVLQSEVSFEGRPFYINYSFVKK